MNADAILRTVREEVGRVCRGRLVSLKVFGSFARGAAGPASDLDILAVLDVPPAETLAWAVKIRTALALPVPVDVLVRTPDQLRERLAMGDGFFRSVAEEGVELVGSPR